jgi:4-alpha-glucanotransferase
MRGCVKSEWYFAASHLASRAVWHRRSRADFSSFCEQHAFWLEDYALFTALKEAHGGRLWSSWEESVAKREADALVQWRNTLAEEVHFCKYVQPTFFKQWHALRRYCQAHGVRMIGDMPIYVAYDSAEVWAHRPVFHLDEQGHPLVVAGVPPDYFSATGQRWGNPIYRCEAMAPSGYQWRGDHHTAWASERPGSFRSSSGHTARGRGFSS